VTAVHQFLPTFAGRDAIGMHCSRLQRILREAGYDSEIYAADAHDDVRHLVRDSREFRVPAGEQESTWALYHFSVGSPLVEHLETLGIPVGIDYHNITEARYFLRWEPVAASIMYEGRRQLASIAKRTQFAIADSSFNEAELIRLGYAPTAVAPILIDFRDYDDAPDAAMLQRREQQRAEGGADWLYVGRIAPNKCQHDVIAAFAVYRALFDRNARLTLVGGQSSIRYSRELDRLCHEIGVADAVTITDVITHRELLACYRTADVFVCLSEHEGFNVPVLEAMYFGVPVVGYACCAVPETVGDGGLLLEDKEPTNVAAAVRVVLTNESARGSLLAAGHQRVEHFGLERTGPHMLDTIRRMMSWGD
jgi:L-malate glycosyltransferase